MSHFRHRSFILTSDLDVDCQKMICYVNVKLSKCLELKFEQLVFENWTDCNFWQTDFISFDRWNLEHSKIQSNQLNRFLNRSVHPWSCSQPRPSMGLNKAQDLRSEMEGPYLWCHDHLSKVFIQPFFMVFKFLQIWNLENDILIFQNFATVLKYSLLFQSTKIDLQKKSSLLLEKIRLNWTVQRLKVESQKDGLRKWAALRSKSLPPEGQ